MAAMIFLVLFERVKVQLITGGRIPAAIVEVNWLYLLLFKGGVGSCFD